MKSRISWKLSGAALALVTVLVVGVAMISSQHAGAQGWKRPQTSNLDRSLLGLKIAQAYGITLNLQGKDPLVVGLGSYFINGPGDCNGCHEAAPIGPEWTSNPYNYCSPGVECPKQVDVAAYLGGGVNFGPICTTEPSDLEPGSSTLQTSGPCAGYYEYFIYSKNLTPDYTGRAEGGATFQQFLTILKTGHDFDQAHTSAVYPVDGSLLQVMPWPNIGNMTDDDIFAMYEYLSSVPCIANTQGAALNTLLLNNCTPP